MGDFTIFAVFLLLLSLVYFNRLMDFWMRIIIDFTKSDCPSVMRLSCRIIEDIKKRADMNKYYLPL
jgi:hypothetical protein